MPYELIITHQIGQVQCDTKGLAAYVENQIQKYDGLVFNETEIKDAKKTMAELNGMKDLIETRRKEIKKEVAKPYTDFEAEIKPIVKRIEEVRQKIKDQVDAYEDAAKEEKRKVIHAWWAENGNKNVPIEKIFNEKWLNSGTTEKQWQADLTKIKAKISSDISTICNFGDTAKIDWMVIDYMKTLSLADSLQNWQEYEDAKKRAAEESARIEAERKARAEAIERAKAEEAARIPQPEPIAPPVPANEPTAAPTAADDRDAWLYSPTFQMIDLTYAQAMALTTFMQENNMRFRSIAKDRRKR